MSTTLAALSVQTSGRNRPVASAKPATSPDGSAAGDSHTAKAVPEVPAEITASPVRSPTPIAAAMLSPVPGPTTAPFHSPADSNGPSTRGQHVAPVASRIDQRQHLVAVGARAGRPVGGARCVTTIGGERARHPEGQVVVREEDPGHPTPCVRMGAVQPRELGDRQGGHRHTADGIDERLAADVATAHLLDQPVGVGCRFGVVPELGRMDRLVGGIEGDHAVLLPTDTDRRHAADRIEARLSSRPAVRTLERRPPVAWHLLAHRRGDHGVGRRASSDHSAGVEITDLDLGGLR